MIKSILDGISNALYSNFENVQIVSEGIEQGIEEPCFFIDIFSEKELPLTGNRAYRVLDVDVHYFPKTETNEEIAEVASQLYFALRRIKLLDGSTINSLNSMYHRTTDGVLHFFVSYKPIVYYPKEESEKQGELDQKVGIK